MHLADLHCYILQEELQFFSLSWDEAFKPVICQLGFNIYFHIYKRHNIKTWEIQAEKISKEHLASHCFCHEKKRKHLQHQPQFLSSSWLGKKYYPIGVNFQYVST